MSELIIARNNVKVHGNGPHTLIFGHGFGCDQRMWRFIEPEFAEHYRTVLFDYVGSGHSNLRAYDVERYSSIQGYAADVLEICEALNLRNVTFIGHSFSGMVGVAAAIRDPERFAHLIMLGPSARFINDPPDYIGGFERDDVLDLLALMERNMIEWANFLAPVAMGPENRPELTHELAESFCAGDPAILRRFAELVFLGDNRAMLPFCPTPALVLQSMNDSIAPLTAGEFIGAALPVCELRYMEISGHCPHVSHPRETIAMIKNYLSSRTDIAEA